MRDVNPPLQHNSWYQSTAAHKGYSQWMWMSIVMLTPHVLSVSTRSRVMWMWMDVNGCCSVLITLNAALRSTDAATQWITVNIMRWEKVQHRDRILIHIWFAVPSLITVSQAPCSTDLIARSWGRVVFIQIQTQRVRQLNLPYPSCTRQLHLFLSCSVFQIWRHNLYCNIIVAKTKDFQRTDTSGLLSNYSYRHR